MQGVFLCVEAINNNEITVMTSVIMKTEVLPGKIPPAVTESFHRLLCRRNVVLVDPAFDSCRQRRGATVLL